MAERTPPRTPRRRTVAASSPRAPRAAAPRTGISLRHATDLGILDRWMRGLDADAEGGSSIRVRDPYTQLLSIFRGVNISAGALSRVPFELWDTRRGEPLLRDAERPDSPRGRLLALFSNPNPVMTWRKLIETAIVQYHSGNAYFYKYEPDLYGVPMQLRLLTPQSVAPFREPGDDPMDLRAWLFQKSQGGAVRLATEKVLRLEYAVNPIDPHVGIGPFGPGRVAADSDYLAGTYQRSTLQNGGAPGSILSFDGDEDELPRTEADKLEADWQRKFGAAGSGSKVALLTGKWNYQVLGFKPKDMEFLAGRRWSLEEFARMLNLPPLYLGVYENSGLSDAGLRVQQRLLYEMNTIPLAMKLAELFNEGIIKLVDSSLEGVFNFDSVEALRDDLATKSTTALTLVQAGWSNADVNERLDLGFPEPKQVEEEPVTEGIDPIAARGQAAVASSIVDIVKSVAAGAIPRDSAVAILQTTFGLSPDDADSIVGSAGTPKAMEDAAAAAAAAHPAPPPPPPGSPTDPAAAAEGEAQAAAQQQDKTDKLGEGGDPVVPGEKKATRAVVIELRAARRRINASTMRRGQRAYIKAAQQAEHSTENAIRRVMMGWRAGVLRKLARHGESVATRAAGDERLTMSGEQITELLDEIDNDPLRTVIQRGIRAAYRSGAASLEDVMDAIGVPVEDYTRFQEDRLPDLVDGFVDKRMGTGLPTRVTDDVRSAVNDAVVQSIQQGGNLKDTIDAVRGVFDTSLSRARTIARTETGIAMSSSRQVAYQEQGVTRHQWMTAGDEHVRTEHVALNGVIAEVGEEFLPSLRYPSDPDCSDPGLIINCRCTTVPLSRLAFSEAREGGAKTATELALERAQAEEG